MFYCCSLFDFVSLSIWVKIVNQNLTENMSFWMKQTLCPPMNPYIFVVVFLNRTAHLCIQQRRPSSLTLASENVLLWVYQSWKLFIFCHYVFDVLQIHWVIQKFSLNWYMMYKKSMPLPSFLSFMKISCILVCILQMYDI